MKYTAYACVDVLDFLRGRRDPLVPPRRMIFVGNGDFKKIGDEFLRYFIELGGLKPGDKVLDVGCGIDRMAVPLTQYLNANGKYEGFDIVAQGIDWCIKNIASRHPNFHFQVADVYNQGYNPRGRFDAAQYKFPFADASFDFVFLTSVFTHMLPRELENYLAEIVRTLRKNGRCLITFFLLNEESLQLIEARQSTLDFKFELSGCRTTDNNKPENAVAFEENYIRTLYGKYGLRIMEPIHYGSWCGRRNFLSYQDIIVASK
jgi:ubiquinone/menaquinone biosynthesis C-methylase UbiE